MSGNSFRHLVELYMWYVVRYIDWVQDAEFARGEAEESLMVNIDRDILDLIEEKVLKKMTCGVDSTMVWDLVQQQIHDVSTSTVVSP